MRYLSVGGCRLVIVVSVSMNARSELKTKLYDLCRLIVRVIVEGLVSVCSGRDRTTCKCAVSIIIYTIIFQSMLVEYLCKCL